MATWQICCTLRRLIWARTLLVIIFCVVFEFPWITKFDFTHNGRNMRQVEIMAKARLEDRQPITSALIHSVVVKFNLSILTDIEWESVSLVLV